jgi:bifunctional non-homologous end joining protein LigD
VTTRRTRDERTLLLPLDAPQDVPSLPRHLAPMQPRLAAAAFNSDEYLFEVKWDGVRALVAKDAGGLRITDRNGDDLLARAPELARATRQLPDGALLDAELVSCDAQGRPRYELLAGRLGPARRKTGRGPLLLAFDLLYESYRPVMDRPLLERRERLARLVAPGGPVLVPEHLESDGEPFLDAVREFGLEGVLAKRRDSAYVPGARVADWLKVHVTPRMDVAVCGVLYRDGAPYRLLCGAYRDRALVYVGRAYIPPFLREYVGRELAGLERDTSPLDGPVELADGLSWVAPDRSAIVEHSGTDGVSLADDARFRSFRIDLGPEDCQVEEAVRVPSGEPRLERDRPRLVVLRSLFPGD